jgi:hypothetical protein
MRIRNPKSLGAGVGTFESHLVFPLGPLYILSINLIFRLYHLPHRPFHAIQLFLSIYFVLSILRLKLLLPSSLSLNATLEIDPLFHSIVIEVSNGYDSVWDTISA